MSGHGKKYRNAREKVDKSILNSPEEAFKKLKDLSFAKFDETISVDVNLGIDASKGDQVVRGSLVLPNALGKEVKVLAFAKGDYATAAKESGADYIGAEDLVEKILSGWMDFDYAVSTPDLMGMVGKTAKILGPRGLLPNKKFGTVTFEIGPVVEDLKKGRLFFRNDKSGIVHFSIGKVSFDVEKLVDNLNAFVKALVSAKPSSAKGRFIKKITVSSTMGVGIPVNPNEVLAS